MCKHGIDPSGSVKGGTLGNLRDYEVQRTLLRGVSSLELMFSC
jgi:hypothetical protein